MSEEGGSVTRVVRPAVLRQVGVTSVRFRRAVLQDSARCRHVPRAEQIEQTFNAEFTQQAFMNRAAD